MKPNENRRVVWIAAVAGALVLAGVAYALVGPFGGATKATDGATFTVQEGPLTISVTEAGTIQNREQVIIKSEVEGRNAILTLAPEGKDVKPGDLLVELDSSRLEEQKESQQISVINAEAAWVRAREDLAVTMSQNQSDIAQAELDLEFANVDQRKYLEGEYPQEIQAAEAEITIAREKVQRAKEKLTWSKRLHEQRYLSLMELQADELALKTAELDLELALGKKKLLVEFTHEKMVKEYASNVDQAKMALDRVKRKASADLVQAEAQLKAKKQEYDRQQARLRKIENQIAKCRVVAPVAGMVVYASTGSGWRSRDEPLEEGTEVRERQEIIHLPTANSKMADVKIHESNLDKVRVGLPVRVTVDAIPGKTFLGKVAKIALLPDSQSVWLNPDLKVYNSEIHLDDGGGVLRPGMSCRAEILVEHYDSAVFIPVQSVVRVAGRPTVYVREGTRVEPRVVEIGLDNNRMVRILDGLEPGEEVLLDPPLDESAAASAPSDGPVPEIPEKPAEAKKPEPKPGGTDDWRSMSKEERRKRWEQLSDEEKKAMMERFRKSGGGPRPGGSDR